MTAERVLITGGAGFLGAAVVDAFLESHPEFLYAVIDAKEPRSWVPRKQYIEYIQVDITDASAVMEAVKLAAPTVVVHTAGVVPAGSSRYRQRDREAVFRVNVGGTRNMLEAARSCGAKAFVYTGSTTAITDDIDHDYPNMDEAIATGNASLIYGESKAAAESLVLSSNTSTLRTLVLRPSVLFGPGDTQLVPAIHSLIPFSTPFIIGSGNNLYDFTYVDNAALAHVLAVENLLFSSPSPEMAPTAAGEVFFISNISPVPFRDFCRAVWVQFDHVPPFEVSLPRSVAKLLGRIADAVSWMTGAELALSSGAVKDGLRVRYTSGEKAQRILGYVPKISLDEGVRRACDDYKKKLAAQNAAKA